MEIVEDIEKIIRSILFYHVFLHCAVGLVIVLGLFLRLAFLFSDIFWFALFLLLSCLVVFRPLLCFLFGLFIFAGGFGFLLDGFVLLFGLSFTHI